MWAQQTPDGNYALYGSIYEGGAWKTPDPITTEFKPYSTTSSSRYSPSLLSICCDTADHAIVVWVEYDEFENPVVYATGYEPGNQPITGGDQISSGATVIYITPQICCDKQGHAIISWAQEESGFVYKLYAAGYTPSNHQVLRNTISDDVFPFFSIALCCDQTNHAIIVWADSSTQNIYGAGYIPGPGHDHPNKDTIFSTTLPDVTFYPVICCDAPNHAIVAWQLYDPTTSTYSLLGAGYVPGSNPPHKTIFPGTAGYYIISVLICCDKQDHAILMWDTTIDFLNFDIYGAGYTPGQNPVPYPPISIGSTYNNNGFIPPNLNICCQDNGKAVLTWIPMMVTPPLQVHFLALNTDRTFR